MELTTMYESLGVSRAVYEYGEKILAELKPRFEALDQTAEYNQTKVLAAMQKNKLSAGCFAATTSSATRRPASSSPSRMCCARRQTEFSGRWRNRDGTDNDV